MLSLLHTRIFELIDELLVPHGECQVPGTKMVGRRIPLLDMQDTVTS